MEQLLLQPVRRLSIGERPSAPFGHTDGGPVEVPQLPCRGRPWSPSRRRRNNEPGAAQRTTIAGKLLVRHLDCAPATGSECSRVQPLVPAESNHPARSDLDPAPDRRWPFVDRKRDHDHVRGNRHKGDPWLCFLYGRQPQAIEPDLRQPRAELAMTSDQQPGNTVRAQSGLKILRFTKYRCAAAGHFFSPPVARGRPRSATGLPSIELARRRLILTIQFRQKHRHRLPTCSQSP